MATPPSWLAQLANDVVGQMTPADVLAPVGCHHYHNQAHDQWEVTIFVANTETIGGPCDGRQSPSRFHLDVLGLLTMFEHAEQVHWQAHSLGEEDDLGPHFSIEGTYGGQSIWLRVLASAPEQFEAGRYYHANEMRMVEVW
jgi:hypothetical protein